MPKRSFGELRKLAKERQARSLAEHGRRDSLLLSELGSEVFKARLVEAARNRDIDKLVELRDDLKALYRSSVLMTRKEKNEGVKAVQEYNLSRQREILRDINNSIKVLRAAKIAGQ